VGPAEAKLSGAALKLTSEPRPLATRKCEEGLPQGYGCFTLLIDVVGVKSMYAHCVTVVPPPQICTLPHSCFVDAETSGVSNAESHQRIPCREPVQDHQDLLRISSRRQSLRITDYGPTWAGLPITVPRWYCNEADLDLCEARYAGD
jgi:hypothetical protein